MSKEELNDRLKSFYTSARKQDGSYYKTTALLVIYISSYPARPRRITVIYTSLIFNITDIYSLTSFWTQHKHCNIYILKRNVFKLILQDQQFIIALGHLFKP